MKRLLVMALVIVTFLIFQRGDAFAFKLLNDKIDCKGSIQQTLNVRTHQDDRDVRFSSFRSVLRFESLYDMVSTPELDINLYGLFGYYYDFGLDIDSDQRNAIRYEAGKHKYRDYRRPRDFTEWAKEVYVDIKYKDVQLRLGKQFVRWGDTAESRVADIINPLDMKYMVAFPDWEDYKIGLWMARLYYTPANIWQDLAFELVVIPFDFQKNRYPPAGSGLFFGGPQMPGRLMQRVFDKQRRDAPDDRIENLEAGIRIRGYSSLLEGIDWTVSHFYTRADSPLIKGKTGYQRFMLMALGFHPTGDIYTYPHYNATAMTLSTTSSPIKSIIDFEGTIHTNKKYQYGQYEVKTRDMIATALKIKRATMIPWLSEWNRSRSVSITLAWYQYWMLNHKYNKNTGDYIRGETGKDSSKTKFTLMLSTGFFYDTLIPMFNLVYDCNGPTTVVGGLVFQPGDHWQWMVTYQQINESGAARYQNQVIFSARYEFW